MFSPECWSFSPSSNEVKYEEGFLEDKPQHCSSLIDSHFFNHSVSVTLPNVKYCPDSIPSALIEDCTYYYVRNVGVDELIRKVFIDSFVRKGELTLLSDNTLIDVDDCIALTPTSHLILALQRETYQELGLEGKASFFSKKDPTRFVVDLDLLEENFVPGKKKYERVKQCLAERLDAKFDLLLAWDSPEETICPSSIAAYFHDRGFSVSECQPRLTQRVDYNVRVPLFGSDNPAACEPAELVEWMGAYSLQVDLKSSTNNFISTYETPIKNVACTNVHYFQWTGFFTRQKIQSLFKQITTLIKMEKLAPWASLYVHGFSDSPVSWGLREHNFYDNGDNNFAIFLRPDKYFLTQKVLRATKRPRSKLSK